MANLRSRRPRPDAEAFIAAAESEPEARPGTTTVGRSEAAVPARRPARARAGNAGAEARPWEGPAVRDDVTKAFNLRLPEPLKLKLNFIRERTRVSVHEFIMTALVPAVEREIERLERERK